MLKKILIAATLASLGLALPASAASTVAVEQNTPASTSAAVSPLLNTTDVSALLGREDVRILDLRPADQYAAGHIPGAINTPYAAFRGPKDNPGQLVSEADLTTLLRSAGIDQNSHVVIAHGGADWSDFGSAARVYWTLKVGGLSRLSILDGGTALWSANGGALEQNSPQVTASSFDYRYDQQQIADTDEVAALLGSSSAPLLIDARPPRFFNGEARVDAAARYGTLPGAQVIDNSQFFADGGSTLKPLSELKRIVAAAGADKTPLLSFCNTGHWASTNWFVISELAGNKAVTLYPASIVEWGKSAKPMENEPSRLTALVQDIKRAFE